MDLCYETSALLASPITLIDMAYVVSEMCRIEIVEFVMDMPKEPMGYLGMPPPTHTETHFDLILVSMDWH